MDKKKIMVTLTLEEFDELRSEKSIERKVEKRARERAIKLFDESVSFNTKDYEDELGRIDKIRFDTDEELEDAMEKAKELIKIEINMEKLREIASDY